MWQSAADRRTRLNSNDVRVSTVQCSATRMIGSTHCASNAQLSRCLLLAASLTIDGRRVQFSPHCLTAITDL